MKIVFDPLWFGIRWEREWDNDRLREYGCSSDRLRLYVGIIPCFPFVFEYPRRIVWHDDGTLPKSGLTVLMPKTVPPRRNIYEGKNPPPPLDSHPKIPPPPPPPCGPPIRIIVEGQQPPKSRH